MVSPELANLYNIIKPKGEVMTIKKILVWAGTLSFLVVTGCALMGATTKIDAVLIAPEGCIGLSCELPEYRINFDPLTGASQGIGFTIINNVQEPILILWDESAMIDRHGSSLRVMHKGVRFSERDAPQAPSVVAPGTSLSDQAVPTSQISYLPGSSGGFMTQPIFNPVTLKSLPGQTIGLYLMLKVGETKKPQRFNLKIEAVHQPQPPQ